MSFQHNFMAHEVSTLLLDQLRTGNSKAWATSKLTKKTTLWQGKAAWPRPDIAFEDRTKGSSFAIEFKPPNHSKREYVTGLGQAITYLDDFEFSGLVVPNLSADGFEIGSYLLKLLNRDLDALPIALFTYDLDPKEIVVRRKLKPRKSPPSQIPKGVGGNVFWGYWRDLSRFDLYQLLLLTDSKHKGSSFDDVFRDFWKAFAVKGKAQTWEGLPRKRKKKNARSYASERLNARLAMDHAGMISSEGDLTGQGHELLRVGKIYGPDSAAFSEGIARQVLLEGGHLELIFWVEEQHRFLSEPDKQASYAYFEALDRALIQAGVIAPPTGAAKAHFLRDEPKLWNKLGLLHRVTKNRYFHQGLGLAFDWRKIISVLGEGKIEYPKLTSR